MIDPALYRSLVLLLLGCAILPNSVAAHGHAAPETKGSATAAITDHDLVVLEDADLELAESIAASVEGVIAVQQRIAINASLGERLSPALEQAQEKLLRLVVALPLLLVAAGMVVGFAGFGRWLARRLYLFRWRTENPYLDSLLRRGIFSMSSRRPSARASPT